METASHNSVRGERFSHPNSAGAASRGGFTGDVERAKYESALSYFRAEKPAKPRRGFTLIELLVVIAIIGLLASVVMASLNSARAKGRDAVRRTGLVQLQRALELYYDSNGGYPSSGGGWRGAVTHGGHGTGATGYIPGLVPNYISVLPLDPKGTPDGFLYNSDGTNYKLLSHVSPESYPAAGQPFYDPVRPTWAIMVCSGPPACASW